MADEKKSREVRRVYNELKGVFLEKPRGDWNSIGVSIDGECLEIGIGDVEYSFRPYVESTNGDDFDAKREAIEYWSKDDVPSESPNDMAVKVSADVSEAITGFKALSREIREATKAIREYEAAVEDSGPSENAAIPNEIKDVLIYPIRHDMSDFDSVNIDGNKAVINIEGKRHVMKYEGISNA